MRPWGHHYNCSENSPTLARLPCMARIENLHHGARYGRCDVPATSMDIAQIRSMYGWSHFTAEDVAAAEIISGLDPQNNECHMEYNMFNCADNSPPKPFIHAHRHETSTQTTKKRKMATPPSTTKDKPNLMRLVASPSGKCCPNCGTEHAPLWRYMEYKGEVQYLCNACGLRKSKGKFCLGCDYVYRREDVKSNPKTWLKCTLCRRLSHAACIKGAVKPWVCSTCQGKCL
mmetsp:Transcript_28474/g.31632  ORF Transcript_28474/g.31632 Transcript_28474/m.31632 type:complete len:230 (+) Transcript_28474:45-734(+)